MNCKYKHGAHQWPECDILHSFGNAWPCLNGNVVLEQGEL